MKKILSSVAAIALAAALISCGDSGDTNNNITNSDTIISVGTPVVTGKAYPGVNYITWTPVANASYYEVYRTVNNASQLVAGPVTGKLEFADFANPSNGSDFALVDGVTYQYTIYAVGSNGANVPNRAVYIATSTASTYVKATVPAYGTDITKFDDKTTKDYLAKLAEKKEVTAPVLLDSTTFAKTNYNVSLAYPVIPGYKYGVKLVNETKVAAGIEQKKADSFTANFNGTYSANAYKYAFGSGKYTAYLTVAALSDLYPTEAIYSLGELTIADIGEDTQKTGNVVAKVYDGKNVTVTWTPAKLVATGKVTPTTNYNVYRASAADNYQTLTKINSDTVKVVALGKETGTTTAGNAPSTVDDVYGITDGSITDKSVAYRYYVVHTNGTLYGAYSSANNEGTLVAREWDLQKTAQPSFVGAPVAVSTDADNIENTFKVTVQKANQNQTLTLGYVKLSDNFNGETINQTFAPESFTAVTLGNPNYNVTVEQQYAYVKVATGTYLFKLTASEKNKADNYAYYVAVLTPAGDSTLSTAGITLSPRANTDKDLYIKDTLLNANNAKLYSYKLVTVDTVENPNFNGSIVTTTTFADLSLSKQEVTSSTTDAFAIWAGNGVYAAKKTATRPESTATSVKDRLYYVQKIATSTGKYALSYGVRGN